jgi:hypothetical protein
MAALTAAVVASPASAGGSWLQPSWERVEPGQNISISGDVSPGQLGWIDDGPFYVYLLGEKYGRTVSEGRGGASTDVPLGELTIAGSSASTLVSADFEIPDDAPPGEYWVMACNDPCTTGFGDLIGAVLYIGMDPPAPGEVVNNAPRPLVESATVGLVVPTAEIDTPTKSGKPTYLALAPHPSRTTGLSAAWVAMSAGLGALVLALALVTKRRSGTV